MLPALGAGALKLGGLLKGAGALTIGGTAIGLGAPPIYDLASGNVGKEQKKQIYEDFRDRVLSGESTFEDTGVSLNPYQRMAGLGDDTIDSYLQGRFKGDLQKQVNQYIQQVAPGSGATFQVGAGQTFEDVLPELTTAIEGKQRSNRKQKGKDAFDDPTSQYLRYQKEKDSFEQNKRESRELADRKELGLEKLSNERISLGIAQQQQDNKLTMHQRELAANRDLRKQELLQQLGLGLGALTSAFIA